MTFQPPLRYVKKLMNNLKYVVIVGREKKNKCHVPEKKLSFRLILKINICCCCCLQLSCSGQMTWIFWVFWLRLLRERKKILLGEAMKMCRHTVRWLMNDEGIQKSPLTAREVYLHKTQITAFAEDNCDFLWRQKKSHVKMNLVAFSLWLYVMVNLPTQRLHNSRNYRTIDVSETAN